MKKAYIAPLSENIELTEATALLSGSPLQVNGDTVTGKLNNTDAQGEGLAKGYNVWDDDWSK